MCRHKWEVKSDQMMPSAYEQMPKGTQVQGAPLSFFHKKHVLIMTCIVCGKLFKSVTENPD